MTGKGWTWLGSDGSASSTFKRSPNLQRAMQGMVGTRPRSGKGAIYEKYLKQWKDSEDDEFPGVIHTSRTEQVRNLPIPRIAGVDCSISKIDNRERSLRCKILDNSLGKYQVT